MRILRTRSGGPETGLGAPPSPVSPSSLLVIRLFQRTRKGYSQHLRTGNQAARSRDLGLQRSIEGAPGASPRRTLPVASAMTPPTAPGSGARRPLTQRLCAALRCEFPARIPPNGVNATQRLSALASGAHSSHSTTVCWPRRAWQAWRRASAAESSAKVLKAGPKRHTPASAPLSVGRSVPNCGVPC